jgi:hypothetical protein
VRDYASISPKFWIGETGKALRGNAHAQLLSLYLMTSPHSNMIGIYHCPILYMAHETGLGMEGATKALDSLIEAGFCEYDEASETVFVVRMAAYQVGESLKANDNKILGIRKAYANISVARMKARFYEVYAESFHLEEEAETPVKGKPLSSPSAAPPKQLTGTGTEQDKNKPLRSASVEPPDGVSLKTWTDFQKLRKAKRAPLTETALDGIRLEADKAGYSLEQALSTCCLRGWQGFEADWVAGKSAPAKSGGMLPGAI